MADVEAIAIGAIAGEHPAVVHILFLPEDQVVLEGNGQAILQDQSIALRLDYRVAIGSKTRLDAFGIHPGLGWRERIVAEGDPIATPAFRAKGQGGGLEAPAAYRAGHELAVGRGADRLDLGWPGPAVGVDLGGGGETASDSGPLLGREAAAVIQGRDALINAGIDGLLAQGFGLGRGHGRGRKAAGLGRRGGGQALAGWPHGHIIEDLA